MSLQALIEEFSKLSTEEMKQFLSVAHAIADEDELQIFTLSEAQRQEVSNRIAALKNGEAQTYSWDEVKAYAQQNNA